MGVATGTQTVTPAPPGRLAFGLFLAAATLSPLLFSFWTGHIWEDYFITFKHSQNLCEGHGLVFYAGERVHGFTSPLGTLLPALCYWLTGGTSYLPALWLFRLISAVAFAGGGAFFLKALRAGGVGKYTMLAFALLYVLDAKAVDFSGNGMETAFMLLFLGWGLSLVVEDDPRRWPAVGLCWAGLMWTRPDSCFYVAVLALASLVFATEPRRPRLAAVAKSAAICALVYLPWIIGATLYYGSPVPNTIRAKASYGEGYHDWSRVVMRTLENFPTVVADAFRPTYYGHGGWPSWVAILSRCFGYFCAVYWLLPIKDRVGRMASFCFALLSLYLAFLQGVAPWYLPPVEVCGLLVLTLGATACVRLLPRCPLLLRGLAAAMLVFLVSTSLWSFVMTGRQFEIQQTEIEWGNRAVVGRWLGENVGEGERVYAECLGYLGYFSGVKIQDNPGLVSPEVVELARQEGGDFTAVGLRLKPEWMVLRPGELESFSEHEEFARHYRIVKVFDVTDRLDAYPFIPGKGYLRGDAKFTVMRRLPEVDVR
jgi:Predicted membrane protein (DUF2142)